MGGDRPGDGAFVPKLLKERSLACPLFKCGVFFILLGVLFLLKGPTLVFFAFLSFFGQQISKIGRVRRELDVRCRARNKMEVAMWHSLEQSHPKERKKKQEEFIQPPAVPVLPQAAGESRCTHGVGFVYSCIVVGKN